MLGIISLPQIYTYIYTHIWKEEKEKKKKKAPGSRPRPSRPPRLAWHLQVLLAGRRLGFVLARGGSRVRWRSRRPKRSEKRAEGQAKAQKLTFWGGLNWGGRNALHLKQSLLRRHSEESSENLDLGGFSLNHGGKI